MEISTFDEDFFELKGFSKRLEAFIETEHEFVESSLVIALTSKYGSGKTTFLEMWKKSLKEEEKLLVISLNAWESDYYGDPLFAIVSALIDGLNTDEKPTEKLINAAKDLGWLTTALAGQVVNKFSGIDPISASETAEKKKDQREHVLQNSDAFSIYQNRKKAMKLLKDEIKSFVEAQEPRVLFLVDELDRCRPDYAISYLETIKHIFNIKGAVFLLAADRLQLENSARKAFGSDLDFEEYYRKFIHREIPLPMISNTGYNRLTSEYIKYYLEKNNERYCFMKIDDSRIENITLLISSVKLTPRQIQEVFRMLGHIFSTSQEMEGTLRWCLGVGSILMAVLKISHPKTFELLGTQKLQSEEAKTFIINLLDRKDAEWWYVIMLSGNGINIPEGENKESLMRDSGFIPKEDFDLINNDLRQFSQGWGGGYNIKTIYKKIQQISNWK